MQKHYERLHNSILKINKYEIVQGFIGFAVVALFIYAGIRFVGVNDLQGKVANAGIMAPMLFILIKMSTMIFAPLSGSFLYFLAGPLFGFWKGLLYVLIGDVLGNTVVFYISRLFGRKVMKLFLNDRSMKYTEDLLYNLGTWRGFVYARIVFIGIHDIVSYAAGLSSLPFWQYIIVSLMVGIVSLTLAVAGGTLLIDQKEIVQSVGGFGSLALALAGFLLVRKRLFKPT